MEHGLDDALVGAGSGSDETHGGCLTVWPLTTPSSPQRFLESPCTIDYVGLLSVVVAVAFAGEGIHVYRFYSPFW